MDPFESELLREALELPPDARASLAMALLESLEQPDHDAECSWRNEITARVSEIDRGAVEMIPWYRARRMILGAPGDDSESADSPGN